MLVDMLKQESKACSSFMETELRSRSESVAAINSLRPAGLCYKSEATSDLVMQTALDWVECLNWSQEVAWNQPCTYKQSLTASDDDDDNDDDNNRTHIYTQGLF